MTGGTSWRRGVASLAPPGTLHLLVRWDHEQQMAMAVPKSDIQCRLSMRVSSETWRQRQKKPHKHLLMNLGLGLSDNVP